MPEMIGGRAVFSEGENSRFAVDLKSLVCDLWPELGSPQTDPALQENECGISESVVFCDRWGVTLHLWTEIGGSVHVRVRIASPQKLTPSEAYLRLLRTLKSVWSPDAEEDDQIGQAFYFEREMEPSDLNGIRKGHFREQVLALRAFADAVCPLVVTGFDLTALRSAYAKHEGVLELVAPWQPPEGVPIPDELTSWGDATAELLLSGANIGLVAETEAERAFALTLIGQSLQKFGSSLGQLKPPAIDGQKLAVLAGQAPGRVAVSARALRTGANPYELANEVASLLDNLACSGTPVLFFGAHAELQAVFHGGQGGENDPLRPAVCRLPEIGLETLAAFVADQMLMGAGVANGAVAATVRRDVLRVLEPTSSGQAARSHLTTVTRRVLLGNLQSAIPGTAERFAHDIDARTETFGGLSARPRASRRVEVQQHFQERVTDPELLGKLSSHLLGQDGALREFVGTLVKEVLTRPSHQPWRLALQGTPGVGKSDSLALLADWLGLPYVVIDAASLPDIHTAMAQLLGSGRGIVGSYQAGRLETMAKHYRGVVAEIADLDHAHASVRSSLGDLFLQLLETGEAQAATGGTFSCANVLFAFTLNLPEGKDERIYQRVGFGGEPSEREIRHEVRKEITKMVSGAFLSRIGDPILFKPLSAETRTEIVARALKSNVKTALARVGASCVNVEVSSCAAVRIVAPLDGSARTMGARGLVELARGEAARMVLDAKRNGLLDGPVSVRVLGGQDGQAVLEVTHV